MMSVSPETAAGQPTRERNWAGAISFGVLGVLSTIWSVNTVAQYPFDLKNAEWSTAWLIFAISEYYVVAFCLSAFILATESLVWGLVWVALVNLLGAPFACAYCVMRLNKVGMLSLFPGPDRSLSRTVENSKEDATRAKVMLGFYSVIGVLFFCRLNWTIYNYPLVPFRGDDIAWASEWLITTIFDFYTAAACFVGIVMYTEGLVGLVWTLPLLLLGSPVAAAYMVYRAMIMAVPYELDGLVYMANQPGSGRERERLCC